MRTLFNRTDVEKSDLVKYPSGRIKDNSGVGDGTAVNEATKGDFHQMLEKLMRLYAIIPNDLPDNEANGFQLIDALRGLASKNDFIYPLSTNGTILSVDIKLSQMLDNEYIVCLAAFNKASETEIKGIGAGSFAITYSGNFKTNEYVRVIKTSGGVSIIRVADALSLDAMVADALYLKKATQSEENEGTIDTKATTPLTNLVAFTKRVIGADSGNFLAKPTGDPDARNGLLSKEDKAIIDGIGASPIINIGSFSGLDVGGGSTGLLSVTGDISSANLTNTGGGYSIIRCVLANSMGSSDYEVQMSIQSEGVITADNCLIAPVYKIVNQTTFDVSIRENQNASQNVKVRIRAIKV